MCIIIIHVYNNIISVKIYHNRNALKSDITKEICTRKQGDKGPSQKYLEANEVKYFSLEGRG